MVKKNLSLGKSIMKKLGCFTCFIWLSALYIYRYISRSDLETSKKTCAAPFLIFREDIIKVDRKSAYFCDKILSGFFYAHKASRKWAESSLNWLQYSWVLQSDQVWTENKNILSVCKILVGLVGLRNTKLWPYTRFWKTLVRKK